MGKHRKPTHTKKIAKRLGAVTGGTAVAFTMGSGIASAHGEGDVANLDHEQRQIADAIMKIGDKRGESDHAQMTALQAGMTESKLRNVNYGDRDSLGVFQMRPSMGWGTPEQVTDIPYAVNKFYDVLHTVPGWQSMSPGAAAQEVERSAYPERYHTWEDMARVLVNSGKRPAHHNMTVRRSPVLVVQAGDTLSSLAIAHGTNWHRLWEANRDRVANPDLIYVGQKLRIP